MVTRHNISTADVFYRGAAHRGGMNPDGRRGTVISNLYKVNYGAVVTADVNGIAEAQSDTGAHTLTLDGALVSSGVATLDVPRTLVIDSGGADTAVLTITGTDEYGAALVETITLNGTTAVLGVKAFKTVTSITSSATIANGAFVGTTDTLGLPYRALTAEAIVSAAVDGSVEDTTIVAAVVTDPATAITGDVRGTVDFVQASNGTLVFSVLMEVDATSGVNAVGVLQFGG